MRIPFLSFCFLSSSVIAASDYPKMFVGAKGGYQWANDSEYHHSNLNSTVLGVYTGLQISPSWSWDIGYQYHDKVQAELTSIEVYTSLVESAIRYDWYVKDDLSFYGRVGATYWNMEKAQGSVGKTNDTGFSPLGEIGLNYHVTPSVRLSAGYQYINGIGNASMGQYDSLGAVLSVSYVFGSDEQTIPQAPLEITNDIAPVLAPTAEPAVDIEPTTKESVFSETKREGYFQFDSTTLTPEFIQYLNDVALILKAHPNSRAVIVGHTDSTGPERYNLLLSQRRAKAVVNQLSHFGISSAQYEWRGEGEHSPIYDNKTEQGRVKNRRVEVIIPGFKF